MSIRILQQAALSRWMLAASYSVLVVSLAWSQPIVSPGQAKKNDAQEAAGAAHQYAFTQAKALAKTNNLSAAEQTLTPFNLAKANTAEWHLETAQRLVQLAEQVARDGSPTNVSPLVRNALQHLARAEGLAPTPSAALNAKLLAGFIHERFLADSTAALASYKAAAQLAPDSTQAKEKSERVQRTDDTFRGKPQSPGK